MKPPQSWMSETLYFSGDDYFSAIFKDIELAKESIQIETYIFDLDSLGHKVIEALKRAAIRGIKIQVLVDGFGTLHFQKELEEIFSKIENIEFKIYHPLFFALRNINNRVHRKTWIFDGRVLYAGSINISEVHTSLYPTPWKDCAMRVEGEPVALAIEAFKKSFEKKTSLSKLIKYNSQIQNSLVRLNSSVIKRRAYNNILLKKLKLAKTRVWIGNAYFSPHLRLLWRIRRCAKKGLDVRIVVPHVSDVFFMKWVTSSYYWMLFKAGVQIYEFLPSVYHAKVFLADDWMIVGSSNLNYRSTFHDLELDLELTHDENKILLEEELRKNFSQSQLINKEYFMKLSWSERVLGRILASFVLVFKWWI